jgi:hypothetical protein
LARKVRFARRARPQRNIPSTIFHWQPADGIASAEIKNEFMLPCHPRHFLLRPTVPRGCAGGALLETIITMTITAIFLSGLHLTNSQVVAQVRASMESSAALRVLAGRTEQVRSATWSQITNASALQSTLLAGGSDSCEPLGNLVETIEINAHLAPAGTVEPIQLTRSNAGVVQIINPGDGTMLGQSSVRVDLTALWTGKGGRNRTRQVTLVLAQGGLLGRN